jgi:flagellar L-ring protein FlgH
MSSFERALALDFARLRLAARFAGRCASAGIPFYFARLRLAARFACLCLLSVPLTGCIEHALREAVRPTEYAQPPRVAMAPASPGAIWPGDTGAGSFLYFDRKARGLGDLVTVIVQESLAATGSASTELEKQSSISADATTDLGFTDALQDLSRGLFDLLGFGQTGTNVAGGGTLNALSSNQGTQFEGDGSTQRRSSMTGILTCRVVELVGADLFRIQGKRQILVNHELQMITVEGLVRRQDIGIDNTVPSTQLAEVKLTFDGIGVIDDKQRPPIVGRIFDWLLPF